MHLPHTYTLLPILTLMMWLYYQCVWEKKFMGYMLRKLTLDRSTQAISFIFI